MRRPRPGLHRLECRLGARGPRDPCSAHRRKRVIAVERTQVREQERKPRALLDVGLVCRDLRVQAGGSSASRRRRAAAKASSSRQPLRVLTGLQAGHQPAVVAVVRAAREPPHAASRCRRGQLPADREALAPTARSREAPRRSRAGVLDETIGRSSIDCSREQIGQFCTSRLWRQKVGIASRIVAGRRAREPTQPALSHCQPQCSSAFARAD